MSTFKIIKKGANNFWHWFNNDAKKVSISDFEVVLDEVAQTFLIVYKNGANVPNQSVNVVNIEVIDETDTSDVETFTNVIDLRTRLVELGYTAYLSANGIQSVVAGTNVTIDNTDPANPIISASGGGGAVDSVNGQTGVVVLDANDVGAEPTKGVDDNYVTDAQLVVINNTSGINTGDQDLSGLVPYTGATQDVDLGEFGLQTSWDYGYAKFGIENYPNQRQIAFYNIGDDVSAPSTQDVQFDIAIDRGLVITHNEVSQPNTIQMSVGNGEFFVQTQLEDNSTYIAAASNKVQLVAVEGPNDNVFTIEPEQTYSKKLFSTDEGFEGNYVQFNTAATEANAVGKLKWNDADGTVDLGLKGGNVNLQIGQEQLVRVVNKTSTNIDLLESNYQAVRVTGAQGNRLKVDLAQATNDLLSAETIGLVTETILNNEEGFVTTSGLVRGINTTGSLQGETWNDGDMLYLSPTVAGRITKVKPVAPQHLIIIGYVVSAHSVNGSIYVKVDNGYELDELHNVAISTPLNNQGLVYETSTELWKNKTIIEDSITNGVTTIAPSQNAVFDALALKENTTNKQNSLVLDGTGVKFPTIDAVNNLSFIDKFKRGIQYFTDFEGTPSSTPYFATFAVGGSVNRIANVPNWLSNQIGVAQYQTGITPTGYFTHISEGFTVNQFIFGGGTWIFETYVNVEILSTSLERFRFVSGFGNAATNTSESNGAFFTYDEGGIQNGTVASPNWQCVTSLANTRTLTTTTIPVTAASWVKLRIEVNALGTSVAFFINGTLVATHTTNIPNYVFGSPARGFNVKQGILKATGTTNRSVFCDYLGYENYLTTPR